MDGDIYFLIKQGTVWREGTLPADAEVFLTALGGTVGGGIGAVVYLVKTADFAAVALQRYAIDTTAGPITVTLPSNPSAGAFIPFADARGTWAANPVTFTGGMIEGQMGGYVDATPGASLVALYIDETTGWRILEGSSQTTLLDSPEFTGMPTAPTAAPGTNSTQLANTAFVNSAIDALINGAPGALDTLKELADQLSSDESTAAALVTTVAGKAPLASPVFTGIVSGITSSMVGLGNVPNLSFSGSNTGDETTATIKTKLGVTTLSGSNTGDQDLSGLVAKTTTVNGHALSGNVAVTATDIGLGNANNTRDADKPISTATQTALDAKANMRVIQTGNFAAVVNGRYTVNGAVTVTDPTGTVTGQIYSVVIGVGSSAVIGGATYSQSRVEIIRYYTGSAWQTLPPTFSDNLSLIGTSNAANNQTLDAGDGSLLNKGLGDGRYSFKTQTYDIDYTTSPLPTGLTGSAGTYSLVIPSGVKYIRCLLMSGGSGGGSGACGDNTLARYGGGGGAGGAQTDIYFPSSNLGSATTLAVAIGGGGAGGASVSSGSVGLQGTLGGNTTVSAAGTVVAQVAVANNSYSGGGGGTTTAGGAGGVYSSNFTCATLLPPTGGVGALGNALNLNYSIINGNITSAPGGGGVTTANVWGVGGNAGVYSGLPYGYSNGGSLGGQSLGANGQDGENLTYSVPFGLSGAGGAGGTTTGGNGGNGARRGGGGGGGGAGRTTSGKGGNGGAGYARIVFFF